MKFKGFVVSLGLVVSGLGIAQARTAGDQGYGLIVGSPVGISAKVWFSDVVAMDGAFGVAQGDLVVHGDFLFHDFRLLKQYVFKTAPSNLDLPLYIGAGPRMLFHDHEEFGIRLPLGISVIPQQTPWEFFGEIAPIIRFTPDSGVNFYFAIGARYYFEAIRPRQ